MNFAEILDQWEKQSDTRDPDEDIITDDLSSTDSFPHRPAARNLEVEQEIDLHGLRVDEATHRLHRFLTSAATRKLRKILVIHGKGLHSSDGRPVLRDQIRSFLEDHPLAGQMGTPGREHGGAGATWVMVRQKAR